MLGYDDDGEDGECVERKNKIIFLIFFKIALKSTKHSI